jgi:hypothetical protein
MKTYNELLKFNTFKDRFNYLKLGGKVGEDTFGFNRYLNQLFYTSSEWKRLRDSIIIRDCGCDLGIEGYEIGSGILIHHIEPITIIDIKNRDVKLLDPNNLICVSKRTHNAIHFGDESILYEDSFERFPNDTSPWRR